MNLYALKEKARYNRKLEIEEVKYLIDRLNQCDDLIKSVKNYFDYIPYYDCTTTGQLGNEVKNKLHKYSEEINKVINND